jgi:hypothetical protein
LHFEYEDKANLKNEKKIPNSVSGTNNIQVGKPKPKFHGNEKGQKYSSNQEGDNKKPKSYVNSYKKPYPKKHNFKTGNNKFDLCNMHLPKMMHMLQPIYNPYSSQGGMMSPYMPQMMPQMPINSMGFMNSNLPSYRQVVFPLVTDSSDKSISDFLEVYLSLENLNQDLYLRNRIDENGFIEGSEIANHNKLRNSGVTLERLISVFESNTNPIVEARIEEDTLYLRNREFDNLADKILPLQQIQLQRKMFKGQQYMNAMNGMNHMNHMNPMNTMNYVSLQNNYFFNAMPGMTEMSGMYMGYQPQIMNMGMNSNIGNENENTESVQTD